jgi:uncharacterized protein YodC (DUF2158 family)
MAIFVASAVVPETVEIRRGDVVRIKATPTRMTVEGLNEHEVRSVSCVWFDTMNRVQRDAFRPDILEVLSR